MTNFCVFHKSHEEDGLIVHECSVCGCTFGTEAKRPWETPDEVPCGGLPEGGRTF
jgi:hypothetical protein